MNSMIWTECKFTSLAIRFLLSHFQLWLLLNTKWRANSLYRMMKTNWLIHEFQFSNICFLQATSSASVVLLDKSPRILWIWNLWRTSRRDKGVMFILRGAICQFQRELLREEYNCALCVCLIVMPNMFTAILYPLFQTYLCFIIMCVVDLFLLPFQTSAFLYYLIAIVQY